MILQNDLDVYVNVLICAFVLFGLPDNSNATDEKEKDDSSLLSDNATNSNSDVKATNNADVVTSLKWYQLLILQILATFIGFLLFCVCLKCCVLLMTRGTLTSVPMCQPNLNPALPAPST